MPEGIFDQFLFALLGKRKRRKGILLRWHAQKTENVQDYMYQFIDNMLHTKLSISVFQDHFCIFPDLNFAIPYTWLTEPERNMVLTWFERREELFDSISFSSSGTFMLSNCRVTCNLNLHNRRELVRDFVWMGTASVQYGHVFSIIVSRVLQDMMIRKRGNQDSFVKQMEYALQGHKSVQHLICVY